MTFNILLFGHSFGVDCTEYLPQLADAAGIEDVCVARFFKSNCSLEESYNFFIEDYDGGYSECAAGSTQWKKRKCTFKEAVASRKWDVVVFQNSLEGEGRYETVQPWLNDMVKYVRKVQRKKFKSVPRFCWNMFWPISPLLESSAKEPHNTRMSYYDHSSAKAFGAYVETAMQVRRKTRLEIIPSGTAIMNLRASRYNTPDRKEFTRDGYHMSMGAGRYAAACSWFQYFLAPRYGLQVEGNPFRMPDAADPVDDDIAPVLQRAAALAVQSPFKVQDPCQ